MKTRKLKKHVCIVCGVEFTSTCSCAKYCSESCRKAGIITAKRTQGEVRVIACKVCGVEIRTKDPRKTYCSGRCVDAAKKAARGLKKPVAALCEQCGTEFKRTKPAHRHRFCSENCKTTWSNAHREYAHTCKGCGTAFVCRERTQMYCTASCALSHTKPTRTIICADCGDDYEFHGRGRRYRCDACHNRYWAEYYHRYGVAFPGAYRKKLMTKPSRIRYSYRTLCYLVWAKECAKCGSTEHVDVHHVDCDPTNDVLDNLVPLCRQCHAYVHAAKDPVTRLFEFWPEGPQAIGTAVQQWTRDNLVNSVNSLPAQAGETTPS